MIAGIFDRLFKKKAEHPVDQIDDQILDEIPGTGVGAGATGAMPMEFSALEAFKGSQELDMESSMVYKPEGGEYRLKLHNRSIDLIGDITITLRVQDKSLASVEKPEQLVETLEPGKSTIVKFKIKPKYKLGKSGIYGKIDFFDFKSKERKVFRLPQSQIEFEFTGLRSKRVTEDKWRLICGKLKNYDIETGELKVAPEIVFKLFNSVLTRSGLFSLPPIENVNLYRGITRFAGHDSENNNYAVEVQVIGNRDRSKALFRIWSRNAQSAMALAFKVLDEMEEVVPIKNAIIDNK